MKSLLIKGFRFLFLIAVLGTTEACSRIENERSKEVRQDYAEAIALLQQTCNGGNANDCLTLGWMYKRGKGVRQSGTKARKYYNKAIALLQQACDDGNPNDCHELGGWYYQGSKGMRQSDAKAFTLFQQACDKGYARS